MQHTLVKKYKKEILARKSYYLAQLERSRLLLNFVQANEN